MSGAYGIEGERVIEPDDLTAALKRCKEAMAAGRPYLVDVKIARKGPGAESEWYDFYSVAKGTSRQS